MLSHSVVDFGDSVVNVAFGKLSIREHNYDAMQREHRAWGVTMYL